MKFLETLRSSKAAGFLRAAVASGILFLGACTVDDSERHYDLPTAGVITDAPEPLNCGIADQVPVCEGGGNRSLNAAAFVEGIDASDFCHGQGNQVGDVKLEVRCAAEIISANGSVCQQTLDVRPSAADFCSELNDQTFQQWLAANLDDCGFVDGHLLATDMETGNVINGCRISAEDQFRDQIEGIVENGIVGGREETPFGEEEGPMRAEPFEVVGRAGGDLSHPEEDSDARGEGDLSCSDLPWVECNLSSQPVLDLVDEDALIEAFNR